MKKLVFLFICITVISCKKEMPLLRSDEVVKQDRLVFKDFKEYHETTLMLSKMASIADLQLWAQERGHSTLLFDKDSLLTGLPPAIRTVLNKDSEFQLGDSIVWYHSGSGRYYTYEKNASYIEELKSKPDKFRSSGFISLDKSSKGIIILNSNHAEFQHEFYRYAYQPCGETLSTGTGLRKWVVALEDFSQFYDSYWYSDLCMIIKLESKISRWKECSEQRNISYNLNGVIYYIDSNEGVNEIPLAHTEGEYNCTLGTAYANNLFIWEASWTHYQSALQPIVPYWSVDLYGSVTQQILGDYNPPYTMDVYW